MATSTLCAPLAFGKSYHIFFFHAPSTRDEKWVKSLKHRLHEIGYRSGSSTEDFNPTISIFQNIEHQMEESVILAFIISEYSNSSTQFMHHLEITLLDIIDQKRPFIPILLDTCTLPRCLQNYHVLEIGNDKCDWWSKLTAVLNEILSSSGVPVEKTKQFFDNQKNNVAEMDLENQKTFQGVCRKRPVDNIIAQTGSMEVEKMLQNACGVEIIDNNLNIKWHQFDYILRESYKSLVKIMHLNKIMDITEVTFILTAESQEKLNRELNPRYRAMVVKFLEDSLLYDFCDTEYDRMTYNIRFEGHTNYKLLKSVNDIVRHLYLDNYQNKSSHLDTLEKRMETYHDWPYPSRVDAIKALAMVGYIYSGYRDTVTCFACNQSLYGVSKDISDDHKRYVKNHAYWNLDCPYLQLQYAEAMDMPLQQRNPYVVENEIPLSERVERNESYLSRYSHVKVGFDAIELANAGFYIHIGSLKETDFGVICGACHYMTYTSTFSDIGELEEKHMMWSGEECPYLVKRKGLPCIKRFQKDREMNTQYRSSLTFKAIKIKRDH